MRTLLCGMLLLAFTAVMAATATTPPPAKAPEVKNNCKNGAFETNTDGWTGNKIANVPDVVNKAEKMPSFLSWEEKDTREKSKGALHAKISVKPEDKCTAFNTGVYGSSLETLPVNTTLKITFWAKSLSGSTFLSVGRLWGGATLQVVELTKDWKKYETTFTSKFSWNEAIFSTVAAVKSATVVDGEFLLDDVVYEVVPPKTDEPQK